MAYNSLDWKSKTKLLHVQRNFDKHACSGAVWLQMRYQQLKATVKNDSKCKKTNNTGHTGWNYKQTCNPFINFIDNPQSTM